MFGSSLAPALVFVLSLSAPYKRPIAPSAMPLSQTTLVARASSAKGQSASEDTPSVTTSTQPVAGEGDALKRSLPGKKKTNKARLSEEGSAYKNWLDQEVPWIITEEERAAFKLLSNDEERQKFVEGFWGRRDPTPDTVENEFRDEYFRRVMYANERFGSGIPGWKTDRGRIYIVYGPPDEIESHPSGGTYDYPVNQGGGATQTFPFEQWRYRYIADVGQDIVIEFVDPCMCGDYHMTMDPNEKDVLAHVPSGQQRLQKFPRDNSKLFDDLDRFSRLNHPPKFKDLQSIVTHKVDYHTMPFEVLANYVRATSNVALVPVTVQIQNQDMTYSNENGVARGAVNIYGQVTTIGGRIAQTFEDTVQMDVAQNYLPQMLGKSSVYGKSLPLAPGRYLLEIVVKDLHSDHVGTWRQSLDVPNFDEELSASSVILADKMERVPAKDMGHGPFVIGDTLVRPRVHSTASKAPVFKRGETLNVWMQVYNLVVDEASGKSDASVEFDVIQERTKKTVLHGTQLVDKSHPPSGQLTLEKTFSANELEPGVYRLKMHVRDQIAKQGIEPETTFAIE
ncbi:MAG: GWxTD domain-containing protein [Acidobacteria bacterium]|nr:GWxTD domain-containing protein [Acidobacteriota bacterium]